MKKMKNQLRLPPILPLEHLGIFLPADAGDDTAPAGSAAAAAAVGPVVEDGSADVRGLAPDVVGGDHEGQAVVAPVLHEPYLAGTVLTVMVGNFLSNLLLVHHLLRADRHLVSAGVSLTLSLRP